MKRLLVFLLAVIFTAPLFSQVKFGLKVGATTTTVPTYDVSTGENNIEAVKDAGWGFQAGALLRVGIGSFFVQPEVLFASNTYKYHVETIDATEAVKQQFDRLEIPLLAGMKFGALHINAGPSATILIGTPKALLDDPDFKEMYRSATYGYTAGLGLDLFNRLTVDARYNGSLSKKFGESVSIDDQNFAIDDRQPSFTLSVGILF